MNVHPSVWVLHAMAGRFLNSTDLFAIDTDTYQRLIDPVRRFQHKELDADGLRAALSSERIAAPSSSPSSTAIAVLGLTGVLTPTPSLFSMLGFGTSVRTFTRDLRVATDDPKVKAIAIIVDSPGGSVRLVPEAAQAMRDARARKPVVVSVGGLCASAAFWISANGSVIEATPSASVGAIGILTERVSVARQLDQEGIDVHVVSAGRFKSEGHPAIPITDAEAKDLQRRVDQAYAGFVDDVAAGRHVPAGAVRKGYGQGRLVEAADALKLHMIDAVATTDQTIARTIAAPATLTAMMTARLDQLRATTGRDEITAYRLRIRAAAQRTRIDFVPLDTAARAEIAAHRQRIHAAMR